MGLVVAEVTGDADCVVRGGDGEVVVGAGSVVGRVSGAELQDVAVPRWREADLIVGEAGATAAPIEPSEAESLDTSTERIDK